MWLGKATVYSTIAYPRARTAGRIAVVALTFCLWLATVALAGSPQLHHWLHADAHNSQHDCLVTQLNQHSLVASFAPVLAPQPPQVVFQAVGLFTRTFFSKFNYSISRGRAPPLPACFPAVVG